ncbi:hypothetical protein NGM37_58035 [Streptomyces sp. TRM76130]|nr:hypothetical protein [Streptomyces sp. TRM76130]
MPITHKRARTRTLLAAAAALLAVAAAAGCSDSDAAEAGGDESSASAGSGFEQALAYAQCMRENGVPDYPDPDQGDDGKVVLSPGDGADDEKTQAAQEACRDKMPQGVARDRNGPADASKLNAWAECIRQNGVPEFPDPEIEGGMIQVPLGAIGMMPDDPAYAKASAACEDKFPGGSIMFGDGQ